jgi:tetratricopeptide (TPR) repeat protein
LTAAWVWDTRGYVHGARGELGARRIAYERAAALYAEIGDVRREAGASANLGDTLREIGDLVPAEQALRRAIEAARRVGNGLTEAYATANLAATLLAAGRTREAVATLELAASRAAAVRDTRLVCVIALRRARTGRALTAEEREQISALGVDTTLRALELLARLEGTPTPEELGEATALLENEGAIEEGALELAAALVRHRPSERMRELAIARAERTYATLTTPTMRERFVTHVGSVAPDLLATWIADKRPREPAEEAVRLEGSEPRATLPARMPRPKAR